MTIWIRGRVGLDRRFLVGDDDAGAGLGDQEVRAGDADIGGEKPRPQRGPRLVAQLARVGQWPPWVERLVRGAEELSATCSLTRCIAGAIRWLGGS